VTTGRLDRLDERFRVFFSLRPKCSTPRLFRTTLIYWSSRDQTEDLCAPRPFRRIIQGGFVNLTHVMHAKQRIVWDEDDLLSLLCRRMREKAHL